jgi:hypothetical protein
MNSAERRIILIGMLLCVACLAYFYMLDRIIFSTANFAPIFAYLLTEYDVQAAWVAVGICFLAAFWNRPEPVLRLVDFVARRPFVTTAVSVVLLALGAKFIYHNYPFSMDEYAAVFQSKVFAAGKLVARLPPSIVDWLVVRGFDTSFLFLSHTTGEAIEGYWPGFALLLSPFEFLGISWLCNPMLGGFSVYLVYRITLAIADDRRAAGWAVLFTIASGAFWGNAISYYSMQAHLTANLLYVWLMLKPTLKRTIGAGLVGSLALTLHNPLPHALFAAPWIIAMALDRHQRRYLLPLSLAYLPGLVVGWGWLALRATIVQPATSGHSVVGGILNGIFFWPDAILLGMRAASVAKMWVWALPCLFIFAFIGAVRNRGNPHVRYLTQSALLTFVAYFFVKLDQGHGWGYRYFHSAWGAIPILAGCAMTGRSESDSRLVSFAGAAAVLSLLTIVPFQMFQIERIISGHLSQIPPLKKPGGNVYFIKPYGGFYMADMVQIDPLLRAPDLLLASRGSEMDEELMKQNWPDAVRLGRGFWVQQWYLGPNDKRQSTPGTSNDKHYVLAFTSAAQPQKQ